MTDAVESTATAPATTGAEVSTPTGTGDAATVPAGTGHAAAGPATGVATRGATTVSDEVIEKIAAAAARAVPGVADLGGDVSRFFNNVLDRIGLDEVGDARRGVSAEVKGSAVVVDIVLVIAVGHPVDVVTAAVRTAVIDAVEKYGLQVTQVNIEVDDIELDAEPPTGG